MLLRPQPTAHSTCLNYANPNRRNLDTFDPTPNSHTQVEAQLHPKRCAAKSPIAPAMLRWMIGGSVAAVLLALLLTCGTGRKKAKAG